MRDMMNNMKQMMGNMGSMGQQGGQPGPLGQGSGLGKVTCFFVFVFFPFFFSSPKGVCDHICEYRIQIILFISVREMTVSTCT